MIRYNIGGGLTLLLLLAGIVLTFITIRRMMIGQITLPIWTKIVLTVVMILSLLFVLFSMLPPIDIPLDNPFVNEDTHIITPADSISDITP